MKKILVIDGNSIINRAFYGVRPLTTKSGKHTNAIYGMVSIISRHMKEICPDYAAVAFDLKAPTFRHKMYPEYKAGRHPTPPELLSQFDDAKECLRLMGIHVLELVGYEADDIQGTVAKMADGKETESFVLSGDRDLLQLIDEKTTVLLATNTETKVMTPEKFTEEYGVSPSAFVDMKALMGDSSDNIPGVAGVGKKTAESLIKDFGSLDGVYENIEDKRISKGVREKLIRDKENAYLSRTLAEINTHAPIEKGLEDLKHEGIDRAGLYRKFSELELNSFIAKFGLDKPEESCGCIDSVSAPRTVEFEKISADEFKKQAKNPVSIQILQTNIYINTDNKNFILDGELSEVVDFIKDFTIIAYGAKPIVGALLDRGAMAEEFKICDLSLYAYCLNPGSGEAGVYSLISMFLSESVEAGTPCVDFYPALEAKMKEKIEEDGLSRVLYEVELPLLPVLCEVERRGFKIDSAGIKEYGEALLSLAGELSQRIYMLAGREFNLNSPKQLGEVLFEDLGLVTKKKKKSGYSTDAETLNELRPQSPIIDDILEYRQVTKLYNTYCAVLPTLADENGRVHTDFKQAHTATGRLSSADPNLQNIPIRTKLGRELRRYFVAKEGYTLVDADYSQIELRLLAHIADDYTMRESFISGDDIHTSTAAAVFGVPREEVTSEMRSRAKAVNFGIVYGISGYSLSEDIGTSVAEATRYIKNYLMNYPSVDRYLETVVEDAKRDGYTTTVMGRRRYIPELTSSNGMLRAFGKRVAMNAPIQGSAADLMKLAMIRVDRRLKSEGLDAGIVMQVHDELVVEVSLADKERAREIVKSEMEGVMSLTVPLTVEVTEGVNWLVQE